VAIGHAAGGDHPGDEAAVNADLTDRPGLYRVRKGLPAGGSRIRTLGPSYEEPRFPGPRSWTAFSLGGARVFGTATPYP
jgi:hypothetical protein